MIATYRAWRAGFTRRWHTNFDLCDTVDYDCGHQGRVCILILRLFPEASRALLIAAVTHDQGEVAAGDVSYDAKRANPEFGAMAARIESAEIAQQGLPQHSLTAAEAGALKLCDWLDAWLWMSRHKPQLADRADWLAQLSSMIGLAQSFGVEEHASQLMRAALLPASPVSAMMDVVKRGAE